MSARPRTPPARSTAPSKPPLTPEQVRRIEENRLRAKAIRAQHEASARSTELRTPSGYLTGQKRPHEATRASSNETTVRDARRPSATPGPDGKASGSGNPPINNDIQAARKFTKYIEYDFSKMTDTKGGFLSADDDPHNKALHAADPEDAKPAHMTMKEWERHQLLKKLREQRAGPFEPGMSVLNGKDKDAAGCVECKTFEIDWKWEEVFGVRVCNGCKDKYPEKYSLLTKTEAHNDYLLTDPELRDAELLPHLERPNPHKATWNNMQLYLRCQLEEYAFSAKKWGSAENLDAEFEKREREKKRRKEDKFKNKLLDLKKRTRIEAYKKGLASGGTTGVAQFGDKIERRGERHEHEWGIPLETADGTSIKKCVECGMEIEELEF